jgi:hypothetical protein
MKFAVQLIGGSKPTMERAAKCFQGDAARIRTVGDEWFLESCLFDACTAPGQVFPVADELLRLIDVTGVFCTSGSEREFTLEESWYADEEIQAGADCDTAAAG